MNHHTHRDNQPGASTVRMKRYRSDWDPGVAFIYGPDKAFYQQFDSGKAGRLITARWTPGEPFFVRLLTHHGDDFYDDWLTFTVTGNPDDYGTYWTGPGDWVHPTTPALSGQMYYGVSIDGATLHRHDKAVPQQPAYDPQPLDWNAPTLTLR